MFLFFSNSKWVFNEVWISSSAPRPSHKLWSCEWLLWHAHMHSQVLGWNRVTASVYCSSSALTQTSTQPLLWGDQSFQQWVCVGGGRGVSSSGSLWTLLLQESLYSLCWASPDLFVSAKWTCFGTFLICMFERGVFFSDRTSAVLISIMSPQTAQTAQWQSKQTNKKNIKPNPNWSRFLQDKPLISCSTPGWKLSSYMNLPREF